MKNIVENNSMNISIKTINRFLIWYNEQNKK